MSSKRKEHDIRVNLENAIRESINSGWMQKLLKLPKDDLTLIIGELANQRVITNQSIKTARMTLPSFSAAKWAYFAEETSLPSTPIVLPNVRLEPFVTPSYSLPPSFHEAVIQSSWRTQDVLREKTMLTNEEAVRLLDPVREQ
jgi:hypothetical protein